MATHVGVVVVVVVVVVAFISLVGGIIAVVDVDDTVVFVFANDGVLELLLVLLLMSTFSSTLVLSKFFLISAIYHFRNSSLRHL